MSIKVLINGAAGRMGRKLSALIEEQPDMEVCARIDAFGNEDEGFIRSIEDFDGDCDVAIDFSFHTSAPALMDYCVKRGLPCVVCTTGHTDDEKAAIVKASTSIPVFQSANMSVGIALLNRLVKQAALIFPEAEVEIIEAHHNKKKDAPSGTAVSLAEVVTGVKGWDYDKDVRHGRQGIVGARTQHEIGMHSIRGGDIVGDHTVLFAADGERVELTHKASSRNTFAKGALRAARWLMNAKPGMYDMQDVLGFK